MLCSTSSASNAGSTTLVAPSENIAKATTPAACERGAVLRHTGSMSSQRRFWWASSVIVPQERFVTITPLAGPVVPPLRTQPTSPSQFPPAPPHLISFGAPPCCLKFFHHAAPLPS